MNLLEQVLDPTAADTGAEELSGEIGDLMRLVQDDRVGGAEDVPKPILLQRQICQEKVVVDDDHVGIESGFPSRSDMASGEFRAPHAETVFTRRSDLRPHGVRIRKATHLGQVSGPGGERPAADSVEQLRVRGAPRVRVGPLGIPVDEGQLLGLEGGIPHAMAAQVVCAALEERDPRGTPECRRHERQVLGEELILQRPSARRDQHAKP